MECKQKSLALVESIAKNAKLIGLEKSALEQAIKRVCDDAESGISGQLYKNLTQKGIINSASASTIREEELVMQHLIPDLANIVLEYHGENSAAHDEIVTSLGVAYAIEMNTPKASLATVIALYRIRLGNSIFPVASLIENCVKANHSKTESKSRCVIQ